MKGKVLVVDDMEVNRAILLQILRDEYELVEAENGKEALAIMEEQRDSLSIVLLDLVMPQMDGFAVLKEMNERGWIEELPVLVITGEDSEGVEEQCFESGVSDFIRKPFNHILVRMRVCNIVKLYQYKNELADLEEDLVEKTLRELQQEQ